MSTAYEQDPLFKGYCLMPIGGTPTNYFTNDLVNEKTFLLRIVNSHIPFFIQDYKPAGLTNWRTFKDANITIDAKVAALISQGCANEEILKEMREYDWFSPCPSDGTFETAARSILRYL